MPKIKERKIKTISEDKIIEAVLNWAYRNRYGLRPKIKHGHEKLGSILFLAKSQKIN